jgi:hypothetical protein
MSINFTCLHESEKLNDPNFRCECHHVTFSSLLYKYFDIEVKQKRTWEFMTKSPHHNTEEAVKKAKDYWKEIQENLYIEPLSECKGCGSKINKKYVCNDVCHLCDTYAQPIIANPICRDLVKLYFPNFYNLLFNN